MRYNRMTNNSQLKAGTLSSCCDRSGYNNIAEINAGSLKFPTAGPKLGSAKARKHHRQVYFDEILSGFVAEIPVGKK